MTASLLKLVGKQMNDNVAVAGPVDQGGGRGGGHIREGGRGVTRLVISGCVRSG